MQVNFFLILGKITLVRYLKVSFASLHCLPWFRADGLLVIPAPAFEVLPGNWGSFHEGGRMTLAGQGKVWLFDWGDTLNANSDEILYAELNASPAQFRSSKIRRSL